MQFPSVTKTFLKLILKYLKNKSEVRLTDVLLIPSKTMWQYHK